MKIVHYLFVGLFSIFFVSNCFIRIAGGISRINDDKMLLIREGCGVLTGMRIEETQYKAVKEFQCLRNSIRVVYNPYWLPCPYLLPYILNNKSDFSDKSSFLVAYQENWSTIPKDSLINPLKICGSNDLERNIYYTIQK